jgi:exonuclease SbcC
MAAFAFSDGDIRKSYNALYAGFKEFYAQQRAKLDVLDLAFVFCVQPDVPDLDSFSSNIETDVYFCRKFVIPLVSPLGDALARLPFLPLIPLNGRPFRPPSAQTFLQQCGVHAALARYLVVQQERSPEGIVEDCARGTFGEPRDLTPTINMAVARVERTVAPVQLGTVVIKNFRAYRKPQTFNVGADVTVLYGPNGFGKTSFFDAIDFAVTGDIGRIKSTSEAHFKKTAKHLDSNSEQSVVSLSFISDGTARKLMRMVSNRKQATLDGSSLDRKAILAALTGGDSPGTDRVENFVSLFRATHLFSQEHQELAKGFEDDCTLSGQIVSRMLAFEDYANAVNKAVKVRELVQTAITNLDEEIRQLSKQIEDEKRELDRLGQTAQSHTNVGALDTEIGLLRDKIGEVGISSGPGKPDVTVVRGWRASLEARYAQSQSRIARLASLAKEAANLTQMIAEFADLQHQLTNKEQELSAADEKRAVAEMNLQVEEQRLAEISAKQAEEQARGAQLEWVRLTKPRFDKILERQREVSEELNHARAVLVQQQLAEEKAAADLSAQNNLSAQVTEKLATKRAELAALQSLDETTIAWKAAKTQLATVIETEQALLTSLESLREEERQLSPQIAELDTERAHLSQQIQEVDQSQSELKRLLSQLQGHVRDGTCPLCGVNHGSKDELIGRIQKHIVADAASSTRIQLSSVQEKARQLAGRAADNKQQRQAVDARLASLKNERAKLTAEIEDFADSIAKLAIVLEASVPTPTEQLQVQRDRVQQEIAEMNHHLQEVAGGLQAARTTLADVKKLVSTRIAEITDRDATLARLQEEATQLRKDPRLVQVSLDIEPEQLASLESLNLQNLRTFGAEAADAQNVVANAKPLVGTLRHESTALKAQISALRIQIANLQRTMSQITARLGEAKLQPNVSEDALLAMIADESRSQAQFLALRDSAASIELAIDVATTAAALTQLLQNVRNKESALTTATGKRDQSLPWLKYFDALCRLVSSQQSEGIANFTREYGPRTSVIQRRLRSVYGFDEIEIRSHESTISVRVKRHGEELRPTDYFSQSQQQTLLLSLFLTACLSQTWSALSPVFLDDPVTHFDDLNTYAFLDLIVGLLESGSGQRQFVMSTCDERFLQLARQKFRHLGVRARFYVFSAISADGPVVEEIAQP